MEKKETTTICKKCEYIWKTKSPMYFTSCPRCRSQVQIKDVVVKGAMRKAEVFDESKAIKTTLQKIEEEQKQENKKWNPKEDEEVFRSGVAI